MSNSHVDAAFRAILAGICPPPHPCRHHPLVESVAPIALRLCAECLENAHRAYAEYDAARESYHARAGDEYAPDGRNIMDYHHAQSTERNRRRDT